MIGDPTADVHTRRQVSSNFCMFVNFVYFIEPKKVRGTLDDIDWISTMQDEFYELKRYNVWTLVPCPHGKTTDGTC